MRVNNMDPNIGPANLRWTSTLQKTIPSEDLAALKKYAILSSFKGQPIHRIIEGIDGTDRQIVPQDAVDQMVNVVWAAAERFVERRNSVLAKRAESMQRRVRKPIRITPLPENEATGDTLMDTQEEWAAEETQSYMQEASFGA